mmetsp:Transcript_83129/g.220585  ORF Transcript_83129/g.220585 Transcript_83129/m.220585 type:complete len:251 (+) Transcript_83129:360-1112(+)
MARRSPQPRPLLQRMRSSQRLRLRVHRSWSRSSPSFTSSSAIWRCCRRVSSRTCRRHRRPAPQPSRRRRRSSRRRRRWSSRWRPRSRRAATLAAIPCPGTRRSTALVSLSGMRRSLLPGTRTARRVARTSARTPLARRSASPTATAPDARRAAVERSFQAAACSAGSRTAQWCAPQRCARGPIASSAPPSAPSPCVCSSAPRRSHATTSASSRGVCGSARRRRPAPSRSATWCASRRRPARARPTRSFRR